MNIAADTDRTPTRRECEASEHFPRIVSALCPFSFTGRGTDADFEQARDQLMQQALGITRMVLEAERRPRRAFVATEQGPWGWHELRVVEGQAGEDFPRPTRPRGSDPPRPPRPLS